MRTLTVEMLDMIRAAMAGSGPVDEDGHTMLTEEQQEAWLEAAHWANEAFLAVCSDGSSCTITIGDVVNRKPAIEALGRELAARWVEAIAGAPFDLDGRCLLPPAASDEDVAYARGRYGGLSAEEETAFRRAFMDIVSSARSEAWAKRHEAMEPRRGVTTVDVDARGVWPKRRP